MVGNKRQFCSFMQVCWKNEIIYWILEGHRRLYDEIIEWAGFHRKVTRTKFKNEILKFISYREYYELCNLI